PRQRQDELAVRAVERRTPGVAGEQRALFMTLVDGFAEGVVRQDAGRELLPFEREQERESRIVDTQRRRLADQPQSGSLALSPDLHFSGLLLLNLQLLLGFCEEDFLHVNIVLGE